MTEYAVAQAERLADGCRLLEELLFRVAANILAE